MIATQSARSSQEVIFSRVRELSQRQVSLKRTPSTLNQAFEERSVDHCYEASTFKELKRIYLEEVRPAKVEVSPLCSVKGLACQSSDPACEGQCQDNEVARLLAMSEQEKDELGRAVLSSILAREDSTRSVQEGGDYSLSFSGTKRDTEVEKEFGEMLRGTGNMDEEGVVPPLLRHIECSDEDMRKLRAAGKWVKFLGAKNCYMWIHVLTREVTALRPSGYEDPVQEEAEEDENETGGMQSCQMSDLPHTLTSIIEEEKKTPLLIDISEEGKVSAYFSYKVSDLMELVRSKTVAALKSGSRLVLRLGHLTSEQANFKNKLCKRDVFPTEIFQEGGKKMFAPASKPRCNLLFREADMDQGQCLTKPDFDFCAVTCLRPKEVQEKLREAIPLGYMKPLVVW